MYFEHRNATPCPNHTRNNFDDEFNPSRFAHEPSRKISASDITESISNSNVTNKSTFQKKIEETEIQRRMQTCRGVTLGEWERQLQVSSTACRVSSDAMCTTAVARPQRCCATASDAPPSPAPAPPAAATSGLGVMSRRHKRIEGVRRGLRMRSGRRRDRGPRRLERPHTTIGDLTGGRAADLTSFGGGERLKNAMGPWFVATEGGRRRRHKYCPFLEKSFIRLR